MKTFLNYSFVLASAFLFAFCTGPEGPPGFDGVQGPQGPQGPRGIPGEEALVYEIDEVNFTPGNDYSIVYRFPFNALLSDAVLVYILWEETVDDNGNPLELWRLLPQTELFDEGGIFIYNFDHSLADASVFIQSNFDPQTLPTEPIDIRSGYLQNQVLRFVIVPGQFGNGRVDTESLPDHENFDEVAEYYNLELPVRTSPYPTFNRKK